MSKSLNTKILSKKGKKLLQETRVSVRIDDLPAYIEAVRGDQQYKCIVCDKDLNGILGIEQHLKGNPHKKNMMNFFQQHHWDEVCQGLRLDKKTLDEMAMDPIMVWKGMKKSKIYDLFYCSVCKISMSSKQGAMGHLEGEKHLKMVRRPDKKQIVPECIVEKINGPNGEAIIQHQDPFTPPENLFEYFCRYCGTFKEEFEGRSSCEVHYEQMDQLVNMVVRNK